MNILPGHRPGPWRGPCKWGKLKFKFIRVRINLPLRLTPFYTQCLPGGGSILHQRGTVYCAHILQKPTLWESAVKTLLVTALLAARGGHVGRVLVNEIWGRSHWVEASNKSRIKFCWHMAFALCLSSSSYLELMCNAGGGAAILWPQMTTRRQKDMLRWRYRKIEGS